MSRNKHVFGVTNICMTNICRDKYNFVATKVQAYLSQQKYVYEDFLVDVHSIVFLIATILCIQLLLTKHLLNKERNSTLRATFDW